MYQAWEIKNTWQVHCEYMARIQYLQMDSECPNLVCDGHMAWYIARNIQNKPLKYILMAFCWNVQNILVDFWFGTLWSHDLVYFEHI